MSYEGLRLTVEREMGELPPIGGGTSSRLAAYRETMGKDRNGCSSAPSTSAGSGASRPAPSSDTSVSIGAAMYVARTGERERMAKVFASPDAHGRERVCATLLASPKGFSADAIIRQLKHLPTDREVDARQGTKAGRNTATHKAATPAGRQRIDAAELWARARAQTSLHGGLQPAPLTSGKSGDVWDKARAQVFPDTQKKEA